jgi:hypothetical protein
MMTGNNRFSLVFLALVASLGGLAVAVGRTVQTTDQPVDEDKAEAVLRHMFKTAEPALINTATIFCVGVNQRDASPALLTRLKDIRPTVLPDSHCHWVDGRALEIQTGKPATIFFARGQSCKRRRTRCFVSAGYAAGNMGGLGGTYHMEKRGGKWIVTGMVEMWIS